MEHRLPHASTASGRARQLAADLVRDRLPQVRADEFVLMVSELVNNAVCHAEPEEDGRISLQLEMEGGAVRAVVRDGASEFNFERATLDDPQREPHFGLVIVDELADRWGLSVDGKKAVWFEVDVSTDPVAR
jgi:serine/threonine-protein kinase RsbW